MLLNESYKFFKQRLKGKNKKLYHRCWGEYDNLIVALMLKWQITFQCFMCFYIILQISMISLQNSCYRLPIRNQKIQMSWYLGLFGEVRLELNRVIIILKYYCVPALPIGNNSASWGVHNTHHKDLLWAQNAEQKNCSNCSFNCYRMKVFFTYPWGMRKKEGMTGIFDFLYLLTLYHPFLEPFSTNIQHNED